MVAFLPCCVQGVETLSKPMPEDAEKMFAPYEERMRAENLSSAAIKAFKNSYFALVSGESGMITEDSISPATGLPDLDKDLKPKIQVKTELLKETVILKLNGGLGTSMGLDKAKSLLQVKGNDSFLDLTAKQVINFRKQAGNVRFVLMNSFSTSADTLAHLQKYPALVSDPNLELMQNKVPKVDAKTMAPAEWPTNPNLEWCPPGHGDLYAALDGSGTLDRLLADGIKYMFVSNSDNLGATLDLSLLTYFAESGMPFMMECAERTEADKKGGHLAVRKSDNQLVLRESAQCAKSDEAAFQDVSRHKYFNTNNLWVRLDKLKESIVKAGGLIPLPMIKNSKTVDPKDGSSPAVFQLETAMGAAIECFSGAGAVVVPRTRFVPVKKCNDLLLLRSDAYVLTPDGTPELHPSRNCRAPLISLDDKAYKLVQQLEEATRGGVPSVVGAERVTIQGEVWLSSGVVFQGNVTVKNESKEPKVLPKGVYTNTTVDLTGAPGLGPLRAHSVSTKPIEGQKPGTSGLRKKVKVFQQPHYLNNFVQSVFNAVRDAGRDLTSGSLVIGGDGRYFNPEAIQIITKMAVANGVRSIKIAKDGLLSTPAASAFIRERGPVWQNAYGAFILSASHNPGGPNEDFGIKYNVENGGPAPEKVTDAIYAHTTTITSYKVANDFPDIDTSKIGTTRVMSGDQTRSVVVEVFDGVEEHLKLLKTVFDFDAIRALLARHDFEMAYDSMHGVQGPYAVKVLHEELGAPMSSLVNAEPKDDFGGGHADPNLTYAHDLIEIMHVDKKGNPVSGNLRGKEPPAFGAAADGDADRNMILGRRFFVTPSDSLAIIVAHADVIPFFRDQGGLKGVARSMPTSGAVDLVAKRLNLRLFETPTGWKFFGNLMDSKELGGEDLSPFICGEESFGTGSDHVREKDGMWAVLAWLSILASYNTDPSAPLVHVEDIVRKHWATYGRNFYVRYDYEGVEKAAAEASMKHMVDNFQAVTGTTIDGYTVSVADEFEYVDPVDGSIARRQGVRFLFSDGSRVVFRLSGTAGSGATVRLYLEKYEPDASKASQHPLEALRPLVQVAFKLSKLKDFIGTDEPTVIT